MTVSGTCGLWTRNLGVFLMMNLLLVEAPALPHGPRVPVNGILFSIVVAIVAPVTCELTVAPLLSVVVLAARAAARLGGTEFMLRRCLLELAEAQVLLGIVAAVKSLLFLQVTRSNQSQDQKQEQGPAHGPAHYGAKITFRKGFKGGGAQKDMALINHKGGGAREDRSSNGGRHGGRI